MTLREFASRNETIQILAKDGSDNLVMVTPQEYIDGLAADKLAVVDAVEALALYIANGPMNVYDWDAGAMTKGAVKHVAQGLGENVAFENFEFPRINLVNANGVSENNLVDCTAEFGSPCIEPFRGAENGAISLPASYIKGVADKPADEGEF